MFVQSDTFKSVLALFVSLHVRPEARDELLEALAAQANASRTEEAGCLQFDVCVDADDPNHFVLYELYCDEAAFELHRQTPHFQRWRAVADSALKDQVNTRTERLLGGARSTNPRAQRSLVLRPEDVKSIDRGAGVSTIPLVSASIGACDFTNGITSFQSGSSLPLHSHNCEESVFVIEGLAAYEESDGSRTLEAGDTTFVPAGVVHRFSNVGDSVLRILWTYGSSRPTRTIVGEPEKPI
jgi:quinol monooxygenase YgiN/quercetin dioxygenase-like cupin family protein